MTPPMLITLRMNPATARKLSQLLVDARCGALPAELDASTKRTVDGVHDQIERELRNTPAADNPPSIDNAPAGRFYTCTLCQKRAVDCKCHDERDISAMARTLPYSEKEIEGAYNVLKKAIEVAAEIAMSLNVSLEQATATIVQAIAATVLPHTVIALPSTVHDEVHKYQPCICKGQLNRDCTAVHDADGKPIALYREVDPDEPLVRPSSDAPPSMHREITPGGPAFSAPAPTPEELNAAGMLGRKLVRPSSDAPPLEWVNYFEDLLYAFRQKPCDHATKFWDSHAEECVWCERIATELLALKLQSERKQLQQELKKWNDGKAVKNLAHVVELMARERKKNSLVEVRDSGFTGADADRIAELVKDVKDALPAEELAIWTSKGGRFLLNPLSAEPQELRDGDLWYRQDLDEYRHRRDGETVTIDEDKAVRLFAAMGGKSDEVHSLKTRADIPQLIGAPITFKDADGKVTGHAKVSSVEVVTKCEHGIAVELVAKGECILCNGIPGRVNR